MAVPFRCLISVLFDPQNGHVAVSPDCVSDAISGRKELETYNFYYGGMMISSGRTV